MGYELKQTKKPGMVEDKEPECRAHSPACADVRNGEQHTCSHGLRAKDGLIQRIADRASPGKNQRSSPRFMP